MADRHTALRGDTSYDMVAGPGSPSKKLHPVGEPSSAVKLVGLEYFFTPKTTNTGTPGPGRKEVPRG